MAPRSKNDHSHPRAGTGTRRPHGMALRTGILGLILISGGGCAFIQAPQSWLAPQGAVARAQTDLFMLMTWLLSGIFVVVVVLLAYIAIRFRRRAGDDEIPYQNPGSVTFEVVWTLIPVVLIVLIAVPTVRTTYRLASAPEGSDPVRVEVRGHQFWWEFRYPDHGVVTANELHIPTGRVVEFTMTSEDVIHSFWVPRLAGKIDTNPGMETSLWFVADEPGEFFGQCAEFCGVSHANMKLRVYAHEPDEFSTWLKDMQTASEPVSTVQASEAPRQVETDFDRGRRLFVDRACGACHTLADAGATGEVGPNLNLIGRRNTIAAGILDNTPENMRRWLKDPQAIKPGALMPNLQLGDEEIRLLTEYMLSLK